jgi:hypothetical protein
MLAEMYNMSVEMRAMNRNIALMLSSQLQDRGYVYQHEDKLNVSEQFINTSIGMHVKLHIYNSNAYVICTTQAQPRYAMANTHDRGYTTTHSVVPKTSVQFAAQQPVISQHTVRSMRRDPELSAAVEYQCAEMDMSHLGRPNNSNIKKARGLMRAGGEASKHLYTDWPHDFVLVGSDNDMIFYKDLTIEQ